MKKWLWVCVAVIIVLSALLFLKDIPVTQNQNNVPGNWNDTLQLEYANTLLSKGLAHQAALAYEAYIEKSRAGKKDLAGVCYKLGGIYMDLQEYEPALRSFYKAELLDRNAAYTTQMNERVVEALENLGLSQQAQYELDSRTAINPPAKKDEKIVARIGKREITEKEVDSAIERLPEWMQQDAKTGDGKKRFIREYVAGEMLYDKAQKLGLDKTPKFRETLAQIKKQVVVEGLLKLEVGQNLKISPEDLELYYKANKEKYASSGKVKISYVTIGLEDKKDPAVSALKSGKGTHIDQWIEETHTSIPGLGEAKEVLAGLFKAAKGDVTGPVKIKDSIYLFLVDDIQPKRDLSFEEVKGKVEQEYTLKKQQEIINTLLQKTLEQKEVEIVSEPEKKDAETKK
jgi:peptidyl-prolyl cis-trans isomerase C